MLRSILQTLIFLLAITILSTNPPPLHLLRHLPLNSLQLKRWLLLPISLINPSILRAFDEENSRFILDPTLHNLDHDLTIVDSFILLLGFE